MSTGTAPARAFQPRASQPQDRHVPRAGYTSISAAAMQRLAGALAADAFGLPLREVRAGLRDEAGHVSVSLAVAVRAGAESPATDGGGTLFAKAAAARAVVASRIQAMAGTEVRRVDIRFTCLHDTKREDPGRVQ